MNNIFAGRGLWLVLASVLLLGACEAAKSNMEDWSNIPERRAPSVSRVYYNHQVLFEKREATLDQNESKRLAFFIGDTGIDATDKVYLVAADSPLSRPRLRAVAEFLAARKIPVQTLSSDNRGDGSAADAVGVVVSRYAVTLPGCPDWTGQPFTYNNVPTTNWGCATAVNLGRMVARPEDLVRGRNPGAFDGEYGARSIDLYRKGETKALTRESVGPIENQQQSSGGKGGKS